MAEGGSKRINVVVKTPKDKKTVEVDEDSGIKDVSAKFGCVCGLGECVPAFCCPIKHNYCGLHYTKGGHTCALLVHTYVWV